MGVPTGTMPNPAPAPAPKPTVEPLEQRVIIIEKTLQRIEEHLSQPKKPEPVDHTKGKKR